MFGISFALNTGGVYIGYIFSFDLIVFLSIFIFFDNLYYIFKKWSLINALVALVALFLIASTNQV